MSMYRNSFHDSRLVERTLRWILRKIAIIDEEDYARHRILFGPIKGYTLVCPAVERPSYWMGTYERSVCRWAKISIKQGFVVYDIGAHCGYLSLVFAKLCSNTGTVYAFEADPRNMRALMKTIRSNRVLNIVPVERAVAGVSGAIELATFGYSLVSHIKSTQTPPDAKIVHVNSITLDDFVYKLHNRPPSFIKIDTEGSEHEILFGATAILSQYKPTVVVEVRPSTARHVVSLLLSMGYSYCCDDAGNGSDRSPVYNVLFVPPRTP